MFYHAKPYAAFPIQLQWQSNTYAYWIGFYEDGGAGNSGYSLCRIDINGIAEVVDRTYVYERGWRSKDKVLLLSKNGATPILTKLDLATDSYSTTNLLASFGLLEVSAMRGYLGGVALTGTDTFGNLATVFYNATTDVVEVTPLESNQFSSVITLK